MKVELHAHTHYSHGTKVLYDGLDPPDIMIRQAKRVGLGAIAIVDHNSMKGIKEARAAAKKYGILVIPGEEISTLHGHVLALDIHEAIRPKLSIFDTVDLIHAQGGIAIAIHPFDIKHDGLQEYSKVCDAIEVFNGINIDRISNIRSRAFAAANKMVGVAGSDAHMASMVGLGTIKTGNTSIDGIIKSIKKGNITPYYSYPPVSMIREYSVRKLQMSYDYTQGYIEQHYKNPKKFLGKRLLTLVKKSPGNLDKLFQFFAYVSFAGVITYSFWQYIRK